MKAAKTISVMLQILIIMPIWWFLLITILRAINASELTWFLFWIYVPVSVLVAVIREIVATK